MNAERSTETKLNLEGPGGFQCGQRIVVSDFFFFCPISRVFQMFIVCRWCWRLCTCISRFLDQTQSPNSSTVFGLKNNCGTNPVSDQRIYNIICIFWNCICSQELGQTDRLILMLWEVGGVSQAVVCPGFNTIWGHFFKLFCYIRKHAAWWKWSEMVFCSAWKRTPLIQICLLWLPRIMSYSWKCQEIGTTLSYHRCSFLLGNRNSLCPCNYLRSYNYKMLYN